jgi:hypothetical protein
VGLAVVVPVAIAPAGAAPGTGTGVNGQTLTVSDVDDLDPTGTTVTVTGAGFDADAGFDVATHGIYLAVCIDNGPTQAPTPCVGGVDMTGASHTSRWITNDPLPGADAVPMAADGSFTTTLDVQAADAYVDCLAPPAGKACKVFVRRDHRAGGDRSQDVRVPIAFGEPAPPEAEITLDPATGVDPSGADVVVEGTGFPTDAPGLYVVYGPPVTPSSDVDTFGSVAFVPAAAVAPDGSFTATLTDVTAEYTDGHGVDHDFGDGGGFVSTFRAHGTHDPDGRWTTSRPVQFAGAAVPASTTTLTASTTSPTVGQSVVLTAAVATAGGPVTGGTVELRAGATSLGTAALDAAGRATLPTSFPTTGTRSVTARFTGTASVAASTSAPVSISVRAATTTPPPTTQPPTGTPHGTRTGEGPNGQTLTATPVDALDPAGTAVTVEGRGFDSGAGFDIDEDGLYVAVCVDNGPGATPSPCVGGADTEGSAGTSTWVTNNPYEGVPASALASIAPDGSFRTTITVVAEDEYVDCLALAAGKACVIAVRADHRSSADRTQDVKVPICFAGEAGCATAAIPPADPAAAPVFTGYPISPSGSAGVGRLASTGASAPPLAPWAVGLIALGAALLAASRTARRPDRSQETR